MTPEKKRALESLDALKVSWHVNGAPYAATLAAFEEVEHFRPVVEAAKAVSDADSGETRSVAVVQLLLAVSTLRGSGR